MLVLHMRVVYNNFQFPVPPHPLGGNGIGNSTMMKQNHIDWLDLDWSVQVYLDLDLDWIWIWIGFGLDLEY